MTIIGGNGAGKSTMLNMIAGVYPIDSGKIILDGENISRKPEYARAKFLGRVFLGSHERHGAQMEIQENLALAYRRGQRRTLRVGITRTEKARYHEELKSLGLGLEDRMTSKGEPAFRRPAAGADSSDGCAAAAETAASGRTYGGAGPQDGSQGAGTDGEYNILEQKLTAHDGNS